MHSRQAASAVFNKLAGAACLLDAAVLVLSCVTVFDRMLNKVCSLCSSCRHISWHH